MFGQARVVVSIIHTQCSGGDGHGAQAFIPRLIAPEAGYNTGGPSPRRGARTSTTLAHTEEDWRDARASFVSFCEQLGCPRLRHAHQGRVRFELGPMTTPRIRRASCTSSSICQSNMPTRMKSAPLLKA